MYCGSRVAHSPPRCHDWVFAVLLPTRRHMLLPGRFVQFLDPDESDVAETLGSTDMFMYTVDAR